MLKKSLSSIFVIGLFLLFFSIVSIVVAQAVTISSNTTYNASQTWNEEVNIASGVSVTFNENASITGTNHDLNIDNATVNVSSGKSLNVASQMYSKNATFDSISATVSVGGFVGLYGGTYNFGNLTIGPSSDQWIAKFSGNINFYQNVNIHGGATLFDDGSSNSSTITLAVDKTFSAYNFNLADTINENYRGDKVTFELNPGSVISITNNGQMYLGYAQQAVNSTDATLLVKSGNNTVSKPSKISVASIIEITNSAKLVVENNSSLNVEIGATQGAVFIGRYQAGDMPGYVSPVTTQVGATGGTIKVGEGSTLNVNKRVFVGSGGTVDIAKGGKLNVTGNLYLVNGSTYNVGIDANDIGLITVQGEVSIKSGAILNFVTSGSSLITGKPFLTANSISADSIIPTSGNYTIIKQGNSLYFGSASSTDPNDPNTNPGGSDPIDSGDNDQTDDEFVESSNFVNVEHLLEIILYSTETPQELSKTITRYVDTVNELFEEDEGKAYIALSQIFGEEVVVSIGIVANTVSSIRAAVGDRFLGLHTNSIYAPSSGSGDNYNEVWISGFGSWVNQSDVGGIFGYKYNPRGIIVGYDRTVESGQGLTLGVNVAFSTGTIDNNDDQSEVDVRTVSFGAYGSYEFKNRMFIDGTIGFGFTDNDFESNQVIGLGGIKSASFKSNSFQLGFDLGYNAKVSENVSILPSVGINYVHIGQKSFSEKIDRDLNPEPLILANWYEDTNIDSIEIPVTVRLQGNFKTAGGAVITPELKIGGVFLANSPNRDIRMGFVGSNESTTIRGIDSGKSRFVAGAGINAEVNDSLSIFAKYDFETRSSYKAHSVQLGIGFSF
ncbi:MAG: autotransporter outer membrane beta-barrel domain-containing protein [Rickettsiales bacterium]|jgi:outer membrane autotransporter protein|nr:autotransporter outer membrane beta-barrel domain-containing protein [Rickettsiales bacterium]